MTNAPTEDAVPQDLCLVSAAKLARAIMADMERDSDEYFSPEERAVWLRELTATIIENAERRLH